VRRVLDQKQQLFLNSPHFPKVDNAIVYNRHSVVIPFANPPKILVALLKMCSVRVPGEPWFPNCT